jgi:hypothetical protein
MRRFISLFEQEIDATRPHSAQLAQIIRPGFRRRAEILERPLLSRRVRLRGAQPLKHGQVLVEHRLQVAVPYGSTHPLRVATTVALPVARAQEEVPLRRVEIGAQREERDAKEPHQARLQIRSIPEHPRHRAEEHVPRPEQREIGQFVELRAGRKLHGRQRAGHLVTQLPASLRRARMSLRDRLRPALERSTERLGIPRPALDRRDPAPQPPARPRLGVARFAEHVAEPRPHERDRALAGQRLHPRTIERQGIREGGQLGCR